MAVAGCYALDLYCDAASDKHAYGEFPHQYTDEHGSKCRAEARKAGWIIRRDGYALCPKCSGKTAAKKPQPNQGAEANWKWPP